MGSWQEEACLNETEKKTALISLKFFASAANSGPCIPIIRLDENQLHSFAQSIENWFDC